MLTTDRVAGAALVLVALLALVDSRGLPLGTLRNPGPAYVPVLLAGGLLVLARSSPRPAAARRASATWAGAMGVTRWRSWPYACSPRGGSSGSATGSR